MVPVERRRCQRLFLGVVRWYGLLKLLMERRLAKQPRPQARGALLVAGYELIETLRAGENRTAQTVHHAVEWAKGYLSKPEQKLLNAVLRRWSEDLPPLLAGPPTPANTALPDWLWQRWQVQFGAADAAALARWQCDPAPVYLRWRAPEPPPEELLEATEWPDYFRARENAWPPLESLLDAGKAYAQDPFTLRPVDLIDSQPGQFLLDLCAAPGGKTLLLADRLGTAAGHIVAVDLPGDRLDRLDANLANAARANLPEGGPEISVVGADVLELDCAEFGVFHGVLLDAPCSNTGVIRRRPDVKWRLSPDDFSRCAELQSRLLAHAAEFVAPGGRLVYSTCSLEPDENDAVVEAFLAENSEFVLREGGVSRPWETNHDGGGAFLLVRAE